MIDQILDGFEYTEVSQTSKLYRIKLICEDREEVKPVFEQRLTDLAVTYEWRQRSPDSSWGDFQFKNGKQLVRVFFKNQKQDACTAYFEGAQCIFMAVHQVYPHLELSLDNVKKAAKGWDIMDPVYIDKHLGLCLSKLPVSWAESCDKTARHVLGKLQRKDYTFHRASTVSKIIDNAFYRVNRGAFTHVDKWNPYDLMLVSKPQLDNLTVDLNRSQSLEELNSWLRRRLEDNTVVPLSLKKVKLNPTIYSCNTEEHWSKNHEPAKYITSKINTGKRDITSSNNCQVVFQKYGKQFAAILRPSSPGSPVNCELKQAGGSTQDGKIGLTTISRCFEDLGKHLDVTDNRWHNHLSKRRSPVLVDAVWNRASMLDKVGIDREEFEQRIHKVDDNWLYSMDVGTRVIETLNSLEPPRRDEFCEMLYQNGAAQRKDCGPYLKVMERCD